MVILDIRSKIHTSLFRLLFLASTGCLLITLVSLVAIFALFRETRPEISYVVQAPIPIRSFDYLPPHREPLLKFKEEISLLAMNTRPDAMVLEKENGQPRLQISFRGYPGPLALRSGQPVFFLAEEVKEGMSCNGPPAPLIPVDSPTPWKLTPLALEEEVFVEVCFSDRKGEFLLKREPSHAALFGEKAKNSEWFQTLSSAKFWECDRISPENKEHKIGFGPQNGERIVPVSPGDFLFYASGEWRKGSLEFAKGRPLAKINSIHAKGIEAIVWDETGFFREKVIISPLIVAPYSFVKLDSLFSSLKQRNASEVSGIMGMRRVVLKPGTWWIKSPKGWKRLKSRLEVEEYMAYRRLGELIIIDGFESFQGKGVLKGRQIDPLRCHEQPFSLAVAESPGRTKNPMASPPSPQAPQGANQDHKPATVIRQKKTEAPAQ